MRGLVVALAALGTAPAPVVIRVTPQTGIGPLTVTATARAASRMPGERVFEIVALDDAGIAVRRSEIDVDARLAARPDAPIAHRVTWTLPTGAYVIAACFQPTSRCASAPLDIR